MSSPTYQFSPDYDYVYIKHDDGSIQGIPTKSLTDAEKKQIYEAIARETYA